MIPQTPSPPYALNHELLLKAYELMCTAKAMSDLYEEKKGITSKYVHATSRGHEAIQIALGLQLLPQDYVFPYYRDDALLLAMGMQPFELMLQLLAKKTDPFSGGRTYYSHPSLRRENMPKIPHQSSATGMQAIPATGVAQGLQYLRLQGLSENASPPPISVCSIGDGAITEGEVSEALQMAALHQYPILYIVQDNDWAISAKSNEVYAQNAYHYVQGLNGIEAVSIAGNDFALAYQSLQQAIEKVRHESRPFLVHARVPLLSHHTSGVRKEWYRNDLEVHQMMDPLKHLRDALRAEEIPESTLLAIEQQAAERVAADFEQACREPDPEPADLYTHVFAPTPATEEMGQREPEGGEVVMMVDAARHAIEVILNEEPRSLLYGQDVGKQLGGVFREAALLAKKYGDYRVFNTPIQEAYIIGSTVGMSAAGCKPIVEIQFADYIWPGMNQLYTEVSRSCYLSNGKWPVQSLIRVPIGAYGSGGPYHSSSVESALLTIRGIKIVYPSNAADMKGLMRAAFLDPNPVVMLEHKGLYWGKVPGSEASRCIEPSDDYLIPLGKARIFQAAEPQAIEAGESCVVITYGMGVHWALNASRHLPGQVEILDLRTLEPLDWEAIEASVKRHGKVMVLTEECLQNSFAEALSGRIGSRLFAWLDAPVVAMGAESLPAIPLNSILEATMLPNAEKVQKQLEDLLAW
ncbi:MAG: tungsten formylmethanofuran dehydrogenase [Bacteroidetes bacterium]|nr:MAG: tungsten formylmethanofuran dehydrogenase [Bacteroidota bacterium]